MEEADAAQAPPLSVLLAATHDAPELRELHSLLEPQLAAVGGELLVADGCRDPIVSVPVALRHAGADVFELRAELLELARGRIIAITEDHVRPEPGYCRAMVEDHERDPRALVIVGPIENGSTTTVADWANFFCTFAPFMGPLPRRTQRTPPPVNMSLKRQVIAGAGLTRGQLELEVIPTLNKAGLVSNAGSVAVHHVQSDALGHHASAHFHNGRATGGLGRTDMKWRLRVWRMARCAVMPFRLFWQVYREIARRPQRRRSGLRAAPAVFLLQCSHVLGEFIGYLRGPGKSPLRVH